MDHIRTILRHLLLERAKQAGISEEEIEKQEVLDLSQLPTPSTASMDHDGLQSKVDFPLLLLSNSIFLFEPPSHRFLHTFTGQCIT
jgi:hypothetical protein